MPRPRLLYLTVLLGGCQLLPASERDCATTNSCAPPVQMPFIIGQPNAQTNWIQSGFNRVTGILMVGSKLVVSDYGNNRVLIWNSIPNRSGQPADLVLGEPDFGEVSYSGPSAQQITYPTRLASNGSNLVVVSDYSGSGSPRGLMFWPTFPTSNYQAFQFAFNNTMSMPPVSGRTFGGTSPFYISGHLYASDRGFNRVLYWDTAPTAVTDADFVLGQASPTSGSLPNAGGPPSAGTFNGPEGSPASDGTSLYIPDTQNHRVLVYKSLPNMSTAVASMVLGQTSLTGNSANAGGATFATLNQPGGLAIANGSSGPKLAVADRGNHRVLLWNGLPTTSGQPANLALGQPNVSSISSNYNGISAASLYLPIAVATDGNQLAVADNGNNRVLIWKTWPTDNLAPADIVLGQPSMNSRAPNGEFGTAQRLMAPNGLTRGGGRFIASDYDGNRVLIWSKFPTDGNAQPDLVLGQPDFTTTNSNPGGVAASSMYGPTGVSSDGTVLAVADYNNNRVPNRN